MSMMRCECCDRLVDTDFECGEYFENPSFWLCDQCICDEDILADYGIVENAAGDLVREEQAKSMPCFACPDGSVWTSNGPTSKTCPVCKGRAALHLNGSPLEKWEDA